MNPSGSLVSPIKLASAVLVLAATVFSPMEPSSAGQLGHVIPTSHWAGEKDRTTGIDAEASIQDILASLRPPGDRPIDRYQFEANLRLADSETLLRVSEATGFGEAVDILLQRSQNAQTEVDSSGAGLQAVGDLDRDYVYTAVEPCRIVDTRKGPGVILAKSFKDFYVYGDGVTIGGQGGSANGCPSPRGEPRAVHVNVTSVPSGNGSLTVFPTNISGIPLVSLLNFRAGTNIANAGIIQTNFAIGPEELRVYASGTSHVIIDVLGYFNEAGAINPSVLPQTVLFSETVSDGSGVASVACPAGSLVTSANCNCDNGGGTRNFGVLFSCQVAGNSAVGGCFPDGITFDPFLPNPVITVAAVCVTSIPATGSANGGGVSGTGLDFTGRRKSAPDSSRSSHSVEASTEALLQSYRDQAALHRQRLESRQ